MSRIRLFPYTTEHTPEKWQRNTSLTFSFGFGFTGIPGRGATFFCLLGSGPKEFKIHCSQMLLKSQLMLTSSDYFRADWPVKERVSEKDKPI